ncbi:MAG TPA: HAD family hydrolase [Opitutaceae bacterium]|nr:HAD family hydrolase [Opitutaceae bacterium]
MRPFAANKSSVTRFRTVLFDLDGTLIDHFAAIHRSYVHTLPQLGLPAPTLEQVRAAVGGGLENAMRKFVPESRLAEALNIYRPFWEVHMLEDVEPLPGAVELLRTLHTRGIVCSVFTNKHGPSSRAICNHLHLTPYLNAIIGATDTPWLKPQPEFTRYALERLHAEASTTLLVGDSPFDVQAAQAAGLPCWAVTTGTHNAEELRAAHADKVFAGLGEMATDLGVG